MNRQALNGVVTALLLLPLLAAGLAGCSASGLTKATPAKPESAVRGSESGAREELAAGSGNPLAGTEWQLVSFQSMDDAIGTVRPQNPALFTMRLNRDGSVAMRLDCNRANGTWTVEPGSDTMSGRFEFGPLAATRAMCPPPNLDERILAHAGFIRGYLLRGGRLHLSLMADGGIYTWEPFARAIPFATEPDADLEAAILHAAPDYTRKSVEIVGRARYLYSRFDLNGDGREEVFAYLLGSIFCGSGGCNLMLFSAGDGGWSLVNDFPITRVPVIVSAERAAGWHNLMRLESGGVKASYVKHTFDGKKYVERERLAAAPPPEGTEVLSGEFTFQDGIPLAPRA